MAGYVGHFKLVKAPFSAAPDPEFAYATREHQLAVAKIDYCVREQQGVFLLSGEAGTGKTTVSQFMLNNWRQDPQLAIAHITNPSVRTPSQFLRLILGHFDVAGPRNLQDNWTALRSLLVGNYREKKLTVLVIDEAHTVSAENMETLTHISNEQTQKVKLIQIVLLAQPNIDRKLISKPALRERIAHGSTLNPLSYDDAVAMLSHRLKIAGGKLDTLFPGDIPRLLYNNTRGVPRRLCMLADNILLNAFALGKPRADVEDVEAALVDLSFKGWKDEQLPESPSKNGAKVKAKRAVSGGVR